MIRRLAFISIGMLMWQSFCVVSTGVMASNVSIANKRVGECHIETFGAHNALYELAQQSHVLIGLEEVQPEQDKTFVFDFPGGTLADLLDMFVSQSPDYRWEEVGTGIHVFRNNARVSLTDVVMSYPGVHNKTRAEIWEDLSKRPEIAAWMSSTHCVRGELFNGKEFKGHNDPISVDSGFMTLPRLLDEVAVKSGINYWAVLQSSSGHSCTVNIILW